MLPSPINPKSRSGADLALIHHCYGTKKKKPLNRGAFKETTICNAQKAKIMLYGNIDTPGQLGSCLAKGVDLPDTSYRIIHKVICYYEEMKFEEYRRRREADDKSKRRSFQPSPLGSADPNYQDRQHFEENLNKSGKEEDLTASNWQRWNRPWPRSLWSANF